MPKFLRAIFHIAMIGSAALMLATCGLAVVAGVPAGVRAESGSRTKAGVRARPSVYEFMP